MYSRQKELLAVGKGRGWWIWGMKQKLCLKNRELGVSGKSKAQEKVGAKSCPFWEICKFGCHDIVLFCSVLPLSLVLILLLWSLISFRPPLSQLPHIESYSIFFSFLNFIAQTQAPFYLCLHSFSMMLCRDYGIFNHVEKAKQLCEFFAWILH